MEPRVLWQRAGPSSLWRRLLCLRDSRTARATDSLSGCDVLWCLTRVSARGPGQLVKNGTLLLKAASLLCVFGKLPVRFYLPGGSAFWGNAVTWTGSFFPVFPVFSPEHDSGHLLDLSVCLLLSPGKCELSGQLPWVLQATFSSACP